MGERRAEWERGSAGVLSVMAWFRKRCQTRLHAWLFVMECRGRSPHTLVPRPINGGPISRNCCTRLTRRSTRPAMPDANRVAGRSGSARPPPRCFISSPNRLSCPRLRPRLASRHLLVDRCLCAGMETCKRRRRSWRTRNRARTTLPPADSVAASDDVRGAEKPRAPKRAAISRRQLWPVLMQPGRFPNCVPRSGNT
jgi:hypothetical protein